MIIEEPLKENALERVDTKENVFDDLAVAQPGYTAAAIGVVSKNKYYLTLLCALLSYVAVFTTLALTGGKSTVYANRDRIAEYFEAAPTSGESAGVVSFPDDDNWPANDKFVNYVTIEGYEEEDFPLLISEVISNLALDFDVQEEAKIYIKFSAFNNRYKKVHKSWAEKRNAFKNFRQNLHDIAEHNMNKDRTFDKIMNVFGDLSPQEFMTKYAKKVEMDFPELDLEKSTEYYTPAAADLRRGYMTGVKIQPEFTPSWAYAAVSIAESYLKSTFTTTVSLSVEQLVEELTKIHGSNLPNNPLLAFKYLKEEGLYESRIYNRLKELEAESSEESSDGSTDDADKEAKEKKLKTLQDYALSFKISNFSFSYNPDIVAMLKLGPVASCVAINEDWQFYHKGVITTCGLEPNHFVTIAGVGHDNNGDYWLIKNSFGYRWGDSGYVKIRRGNAESNTDCGLLLVAFNSFYKE